MAVGGEAWLGTLMDFFDEEFGHETLIAGAVSGLASEVAAHPFETVSHRAKVHPSSGYGGLLGNARLILAQEGWRGIMAGVSVPMLVAAPVTAAYFGLYHMFKQWGLAAAGPERASLVILAAGASAELLTSVITIPSEVIKSRLQLGANPHRATGGLLEQTRNFAGIWDAGRCIYRRQGLPGLWAGMHSCLIQDTCLAGLVFLFYEHMRHQLATLQAGEPSGTSLFLAGGVAGAAGAALTNPLDVITTRLMTQGEGMAFGGSMAQVARAAAGEGVLALWRGTGPRMLAVFPYTAIQFSLFEVVRDMLLPAPGEGGDWSGPGRGAVFGLER